MATKNSRSAADSSSSVGRKNALAHVLSGTFYPLLHVFERNRTLIPGRLPKAKANELHHKRKSPDGRNRRIKSLVANSFLRQFDRCPEAPAVRQRQTPH